MNGEMAGLEFFSRASSEVSSATVDMVLDRVLGFARFAGLLLLLMMSGCATVKGPSLSAEEGRARVVALAHWRLDGRIAVQTASDAFQARLFWEHENQQDRVRVSGPFSQGVFSIVVQDDLALIRDSSGQTKVSRDLPGLLRRELGFAVPLSSLRYWVLGVSEPSVSGLARYDASGQLRQLRQGEWSLDFERFVQVKEFLLPEKLSAKGREVKLKLVVEDWSILR
jgi:outer membrane lipoprotein LolB